MSYARATARAAAAATFALLAGSCNCIGLRIVPLQVRVETSAHVPITDALVSCESTADGVERPSRLSSEGTFGCGGPAPDELIVRVRWRGASLERRMFVEQGLHAFNDCALPVPRELTLVFSEALR